MENEAPKAKLCPQCNSSQNRPYIDGRGVAMRACQMCCIQWQDETVMATKFLIYHPCQHCLRACSCGRPVTDCTGCDSCDPLKEAEKGKCHQCIQTQNALKNLYHAVQKSKSVNDPIGMNQAMDEAGKWF